ncbi:MAG: DNA-binding response regulator [Bacteroidetes bacterium]|nr:MAG: DNA-binding response regulator [Bacteroidota bacterium]
MLIVEDDPEMGMGLEDFFTMRGFQVTRAADGETALRLIQTLPAFDIVLLDMMLPCRDGFEVLREARRNGINAPVVMLTARDREADKLRGFDLGADDYVTKPFSAEELAARVRAVLKRAHMPAEPPMETYRFGDIEVNFSNHTAHRNGKPIRFTALEYEVLHYFIQHRGHTITRKQLLEDVWKISGDVTTRTVDRHIASIRKKIEPDPNAPTYIQTVYGIGYKFDV